MGSEMCIRDSINLSAWSGGKERLRHLSDAPAIVRDEINQLLSISCYRLLNIKQPISGASSPVVIMKHVLSNISTKCLINMK